MDEKKTMFDYLAQMMVVFGFTMLVLNIFCLIFGDSARELSSMYALGSRGVPTETAFQFLLVTALITGFRIVFFTDKLIKNMTIRLRTVCMLACTIVILVVFIAVFRWFPTDMWQPWAMFFACFGICFLGSYAITAAKEKAENRQMEEALRRLKEKEKTKHE